LCTGDMSRAPNCIDSQWTGLPLAGFAVLLVATGGENTGRRNPEILRLRCRISRTGLDHRPGGHAPLDHHKGDWWRRVGGTGSGADHCPTYGAYFSDAYQSSRPLGVRSSRCHVGQSRSIPRWSMSSLMQGALV